ncbi:MAG: hypothetical protein ABIW34_08570 [Ginsengibacter sp.]
MKKIFVILLFFAGATNIFASTSFNINEKVLKNFQELFPDVKQPQWYEHESFYEVYFKDTNNQACRINYHLDGTVISVRRDYEVSALSPFIKAKVMEKYPEKKISGVFELSSELGIFYYMVLEDEKNVYNIRSDSQGSISLESKFQQQKNAIEK